MDGFGNEFFRSKRKGRFLTSESMPNGKSKVPESRKKGTGRAQRVPPQLPLAKLLPTIITIFSLCFGMTSVRFAMSNKWELAVLCVFISALLDAFDGRVARLLGQSSQFGAELDSLSDLVCFGLAPSLLLFFFVKATPTMGNMENASWCVGMFFTVCCAVRLARFNALQILNAPKAEWQKKYFTGVPAPAGAVIALFPFILFFSTGNINFMDCGFIFFCMIGSGVLMISTLKSFSSKMIELKNGMTSTGLLIITLVMGCLLAELWLTLAVLIFAYLAAIPYGIYQYAKTEKEMKSRDVSQQVR
ncbi:MAG: phosphatidylcholine/phosphatidylserine synthase [Holosporaceae bacterium]|jgi:CDP-diacylglycerol--serine O-phosphatidyltransferase|nr:phosphatidylcholine/phosphatidylserine synthase [Holosporaceae bacterium]